jgi:hypothetical protein
MTKQITPLLEPAKLVPLRAGYNSVVPNLDKWRQFDYEQTAKRHQLANEGQYWRGHMLKQWHQVLNKLHLRQAE